MLCNVLLLSLIATSVVDVEVTELTLTPTEATAPTRELSLRPDTSPRLDGNGAAMFFRAALIVDDTIERYDARDAALSAGRENATPEQLDAAREALAFGLGTDFKDPLTVAARYRTVDWDIPLQARGFEAVLPELNKMREMANLLVDEARFAIEFGESVRGVFDPETSTTRTEIETLDGRGVDLLVAENVRLLIASADAAERQPVLVSSLIGAGIRAQAFDLIRTAIQRPGSTNFGAALRELGPPRYDLARLIAGERDGIEATFPSIALIRARESVPQEVHEAFLGRLTELSTAYQWDSSTPAKAIEYDAEQIRAQVLALDTALARLTAGAGGSLEAFQEAAEAFENNDGFGPLEQVTASFDRVAATFVMLEREYRLLVLLETLRAAAATDGLPDTLDVLGVLAIDPTTGEPFGYETTDAGFVLASSGERPLRYEVTLRD